MKWIKLRNVNWKKNITDWFEIESNGVEVSEEINSILNIKDVEKEHFSEEEDKDENENDVNYGNEGIESNNCAIENEISFETFDILRQSSEIFIKNLKEFNEKTNFDQLLFSNLIKLHKDLEDHYIEKK